MSEKARDKPWHMGDAIEAETQRIVRILGAHAQMVAALKSARKGLIFRGALDPLIERIDAALRAAGVEP